MRSPLLTVSQLNEYIKLIFEGDPNLNNVFVCGEISNFKNHYSGHYYMTLKDDKSTIRAVMFRGSNQRLRFMPENGMKVIARGRVSVFERDGQYQLYIDDMQPDGLGALSVAFEQLKERLAKEGLFDERNKKPIPEMPMRVGVVTSPTGAAIRDIINVLGRRFPMAEVIVCPVRVQGDSAAPQIARAIKLFNDEKKADVLIVGRGGGSLEDLWAFNEEIVARAVAASEIPVISAVGHETDYTICDFASDLRAPTPSAAAELAVPDMRVQYDFISSALLRCKKAMRTMIDSERTRLFDLRSSPYISSAVFIVDSQRLILDSLTDKLKGCVTSLLEKEKNTLGLSAGKLDAISPLKVLSRGYAIAEKDGRTVTIDNINEHDKIDVKIKDASLLCEVLKITESDGDGYGK